MPSHLFASSYPQTRLRRTRRQDWTRALVAEHRLTPADLILPLFVQEGENKETPVASMPGVARLSIDRLCKEAAKAQAAGIPAIALFPAVEADRKSADGAEACNPDNLACRAVRAVKQAVPELGVICDVALDPYTTHGQDGLVEDGEVVNDRTVESLCRQAAVLAQAGCDIIAPSDMMDGRVGAIRAALDKAGFAEVCILSYAAKYASAFYGPFRDAVGSRQALGTADKRSYQMDPANGKEALREIALDIGEGADMVMVKPGMPYLDVIRAACDHFTVPVLAYQVSGEYAMLKHAVAEGWISGEALMESLLAFKRAGCTAILTYAALEVAQAL